MKSDVLTRHDPWLAEQSNVASLYLEQELDTVTRDPRVLCPASYPPPKGMPEEKWDRYQINLRSGGRNICQVDSEQSQANRMEPVFEGVCRDLVPQVVIALDGSAQNGREGQEVNLLQLSHRAAATEVRQSPEIGPLAAAAFIAHRSGDAVPMAKLAPTSLVFGAWDSRGTGHKITGTLLSGIEAHNVTILRESTHYDPIDHRRTGLIERPDDSISSNAKKAFKKKLSSAGLVDALAVNRPAGVEVEGRIVRKAHLHLQPIQKLRAGNGQDPLPLRRYILGLALVALTAPQDLFLRQGCQLVLDGEPLWVLISRNGKRDICAMDHDQALEFAKAAAEAFGVGEDRRGTLAAKNLSVAPPKKRASKPSGKGPARPAKNSKDRKPGARGRA